MSESNNKGNLQEAKSLHLRMSRLFLPGIFLIEYGLLGSGIALVAFQIAALCFLVYAIATCAVFLLSAAFVYLVLQFALVGTASALVDYPRGPARNRSSGWKLGRIVHWLSFLPLLLAIVIIFASAKFVKIIDSDQMPLFFPGDVLCLEPVSVPQQGDLVAVQCDKNKVDVGRIISVGPNTVYLSHGLVQPTPTPAHQTKNVIVSADGAKFWQTQAESVGEKFHLIYAKNGCLQGQQTRRLELRKGKLLLLKDNRCSPAICDGKYVFDRTALLGKTSYIVYSKQWSRIGLKLH